MRSALSLLALALGFTGLMAAPKRVALVFDENEKVDRFYARALELGGTDEGPPGYRGPPEMGYYFSYFRDLDGHKFAAICIKKPNA